MRDSGKLATRRFQLTIEENIILKKELYSMSIFDAKPIFQRELVKIWRNAVFNLPWWKTQFSRKSFNSRVDLMSHAFFREKW